MQEVINILGSWLPWANIAVICVLGHGITVLQSRIKGLEGDIEGLERTIDRQSMQIAKLWKREKKL